MKTSLGDKKEMPITSNEFNEKFLAKNSANIVVKNNRYYIQDKGKINDIEINHMTMTTSKQNGSIEYLNKLKTPTDRMIPHHDIYGHRKTNSVISFKKDKHCSNIAYLCMIIINIIMNS